LFLGNTTYAQTVVLATFMGGLAIGASLWGRRADTSKHLLRIYAFLEIAIGVYCFLYPQLLNVLKNVFISVVHSLNLPSDSTQVLVLKLILSLCTLLFPTILMGGTLPVLVRFISNRIEDAGKNVATLYFLNSFGAVGGSLLAGFFFIPLTGLKATIYSAAAVNILIGMAAFLLTKLRLEQREEAFVAEEQAAMVFSPTETLIALTVAGISGLASMIYEVSWVRLLIPVLGSSTYSYSLMLVAFIAGITIGSWIVSLGFKKIKNVFGFLALCQLGVGLTLAVTLPLYGRIPYYFWHIASSLARSETTYPVYLTIQFLVGFFIMVVPTIFLGMTLPVASRIAARSINVLGKSVGNVFSINTLGTVIGSLAAGLILIPTIGVRHTIEIAMLLNIVLGLVVLFYDRNSMFIKKAVMVGITGLFLVSFFITNFDWNQSVLLSGVFRNISRNRAPPRSYTDFYEGMKSNKILYYKEGTTATVGVVEGQGDESKQAVLIINGKADASSETDLPTQVLSGQLPMMFHPQADTVLVIGLGSGVTVGSILTHPVKSVQAIEISPEVIDASHYFDHVNYRPLQDPRTKLYVDDALAFLKLSNVKYDVIVSEPSNPWIAGIGSLYTTEFFNECKQKLRGNGLMVQWFQMYEVDDETFKMVVRSFQSAFPHVTLWQPLIADVVLIGSNEPLSLDYQKLQAKINTPSIKEDLNRIQIRDVPTLLSLQMLSEQAVTDYSDVGPLNTENLPLLEYWAPRAFFVNKGAAGIKKYDERTSFGGTTLLLKQWLGEHKLSDEEIFNLGAFHSGRVRGNNTVAYSMLSAYLEKHPKDVRGLKALLEVADRMGKMDQALLIRKRLVELEPKDPELLQAYAWSKFQSERAVASSLLSFNVDESEKLLKKAIEIAADTAAFYHLKLGDVYYNIGRYAFAADQYNQVLKIQKKYRNDARIRQDILLYHLAKSLHHLGQDDRAIGYAIQSGMANPDNEEVKNLVYTIWMKGTKPRPDSTK
ncbi:MAG: fused MFS/spermidine synthase, partial [Ignavibacteriales bacterium]|nr:fused MFS/spermidine synthase [Ignavibacteriales bacterium]